MKQKDRFWTTLLFVLVAMMGFVLICCNGCGDSQATKPVAAPKTRTSSETETENTAKAGDNSNVEMLEMITNIQSTVNTIVQHTEQTQKSASAKADSIEKLIQKINNTNNSSWLMFGIICVMGLIIIGSGLLIVIIIKLKVRITRAIDAPDNSLTRDQYKKY